MGKSSSTVMGYKYLVAYHHGICAHPIDKFLEFRAANKTAWSGALTASGTITINAPNLFGGDKDQGGIVGDVDVMFGEDGQQPNAYLLSAFGSQIPGWQGFTTLVFKGGEFGAMNPYPQKPAYKILATKAGWDNGCWYPEKAEIALVNPTLLAVDATGWDYQVLPDEDDPAHQNLTPPVDGWLLDGQGPFAGGTASGNTAWPTQTILWVRRTITVVGANPQLTVSGDNGFVVLLNGMVAGIANPDNVNDPGDSSVTVNLTSGATYELAIKGFDEKNDTTGGVILRAQITAEGLTAINPAHVLYEARTAPDRGDEPTANMADASWRAAADWFFNQAFGLCQCEYNADKESVDDFIDRIAAMCGCSVSRDPVDGLWYLDIANGEYVLDDLPILTDDDVLEFEDSPSVPDDAVNSVAVEYFDPQQWTTVTTRPASALALISANGLNHQTNVYHEIPTTDLANRLALRDLANYITPSNAMPLTTTRKPYSWRRYTYFRLQVPKRGIADMVCLLAEKSDGTLKSGAIKITASQDIYGLASAGFSESEPGVDTRPPQIPLAIMQQAAFEAPYIDVVRNLSRADLAALPNDVGYLMAVAKDPNISRDYGVTVSTDDGATYADTGAIGQWCPTALIVEGDTLTDAAPATAFTLSGGTLLDGVAVGSAAAWLGTDGEGNAALEWCSVDAIDAAANTLTLGRGCADTVPLPHAANSRIWFYDGFAGKDSTEYTDGESIDVKLLTNTGTQQLDPAAAQPLGVTFDQRQARPYPPANVQINGLPNPSEVDAPVTVSWARRNRIVQADQLLDTSAADVAPEAGQTTTVEFYDAGGNLLNSQSDIAGTSSTLWSPSGSGDFTLKVYSVRDAIASLYAYEHALSVVVPADSDPLWDDVFSLLPMSGADGSTDFTDQIAARIWTPTGDAEIVTSQSPFVGDSSGSFGTGYLTTGTLADWKFLHDGTTPWTIDIWVRVNALGASCGLFGNNKGSSANIGVGAWIDSTGHARFFMTEPVSVINWTSADVLFTTDTWYLISMQWDPTARSFQYFVDGTLIDTVTGSGTAFTANGPGFALNMAAIGGGSVPLHGFASNFRVTKALRYSGNFSVPAGPWPTHA